MILLLDTGVLGLLCNPTADRAKPYTAWLVGFLSGGASNQALIPEIADYELRRELVRVSRKAGRVTSGSVEKLDVLATKLEYLPVTTADWRRAAELWAEVRNEGKPTAGSGALDGDVILAAQAVRRGAAVATFNRKHLSRFGVQVVEPEAPE